MFSTEKSQSWISVRPGLPGVLCLLVFVGIAFSHGCTRTASTVTDKIEEQIDQQNSHSFASHSFAKGEKLFKSYCAACHQLGGQGTEGRVPPLDNSPWVSGSQVRLVRIVLNGLRGPIEINGQTYNLEMPAFRMLFNDDDIAEILSHVRQCYGTSSLSVDSETVARVRKDTEDRKGYWTVEELLLIP